MDIEEVIHAVEEIRKSAGDDESAHSMEDDLHQSVLHAIANDKCSDVVGCAREALKTLKIDFARWCA